MLSNNRSYNVQKALAGKVFTNRVVRPAFPARDFNEWMIYIHKEVRRMTGTNKPITR